MIPPLVLAFVLGTMLEKRFGVPPDVTRKSLIFSASISAVILLCYSHAGIFFDSGLSRKGRKSRK
jgi:hypothetical protein